MSKELPKLQPVTILVTSFNRINLLKRAVELINERTFYPFRIIIADSHSTDGTLGYLKEAKVQGKIFDYIYMPENLGQSQSLNAGFEAIEKWENPEGTRMKRPSSDFFVTTNEDIYPPMLGQKNCWLTQMIDILERHEPEYGGLCMRIQRTPRVDIDENTEIIPSLKNFPSVYRLMRRSDIRKIGNRPFGKLRKWDSNSVADRYKQQIKKKFGFTTHIYADHAGFIPNKGFPKDIETFTVAANKVNESKDKPYPDIDPLTNVPVKINHPVDKPEQDKREGSRKTEVTIIILTCKRLDGLKRLVDSIRSKTKEILYELLVVIDSDDTEAYNYCIENNIKCILSSYHRDFVAQANLGMYACETPYFVKFDDDMEVVDDGWLSKGLKIFKEQFSDGVGLMLFNDNIQSGKVFTVGISSKQFIYAMGGHMYYPGYKHFGGDRETVSWAKSINGYHYEESIHIKHHHWQSDKSVEEDETYKISKNKYWKHDQGLKKERQHNEDLPAKKNKVEYA